jgi:hypothetical protein
VEGRRDAADRERVLGLPPDPGRARGARHHRSAVHGLADPQERWDGPAPRWDGPGWAGFLRSRAQGILAPGFFAADLLNGMKAYVLAVTGHGTRRVRVLGATGHPAWSWVVQQARNLLMDLEDAGTQVKFVLHDRDASFTAAFDAVFTHRPHRTLNQAAPLRPLPDEVPTWTTSASSGGATAPEA